MSNGTTCCALEICCVPGAASTRKKVAASIAEFTGAEADYCAKFLDWMEHEGLVFAPDSFRVVIQELVTMARRTPNTNQEIELKGGE
jgi:hypothetical protein